MAINQLEVPVVVISLPVYITLSVLSLLNKPYKLNVGYLWLYQCHVRSMWKGSLGFTRTTPEPAKQKWLSYAFLIRPLVLNPLFCRHGDTYMGFRWDVSALVHLYFVYFLPFRWEILSIFRKRRGLRVATACFKKDGQRSSIIKFNNFLALSDLFDQKPHNQGYRKLLMPQWRESWQMFVSIQVRRRDESFPLYEAVYREHREHLDLELGI